MGILLLLVSWYHCDVLEKRLLCSFVKYDLMCWFMSAVLKLGTKKVGEVVASFAELSASSLPFIPMWLGTHRSVIFGWLSMRLLRIIVG